MFELAEMGSLIVRKLQAGDLEDVKRLHKYATQGGKQVFSQYNDDAAAVLEAAVTAEHGAFGLAVLLADPEEPEELELVGAATAQLSSSTPDQCNGCCCEVVLLTLVVRADVRQQGLGRQLLGAVLEQALQQAAAEGQQLQRAVTDIALSNKPAWQFFTRAGFTRGSASGTTAEAVLLLEATIAGSDTAAAPAANSRPGSISAAAVTSRSTIGIRGHSWGGRSSMCTLSSSCVWGGSMQIALTPVSCRPAVPQAMKKPGGCCARSAAAVRRTCTTQAVMCSRKYQGSSASSSWSVRDRGTISKAIGA